MTLENLTNGVGVDSYGYFYKEYRDLEAIERTGPERVSNTAHNVFLDISSGAGIFAGFIFASIFLLAL
jgi:O-antigen ligase